MGYPAKLLTKDEVVVYDMRPHWKSLLFPALGLILIVFVGVFLLSAIPSDWDWARYLVLGVAAVLLIWWVAIPVIRWATSQYVITNRRVIVRTGIIARQGRDMPLQRINDVHFDYGIIDRMLGCGDLVIESASEGGQMHIKMVPDVETIQREVFRLHEEDDSRRRREGD
jgi:uncharacterized membrane protein YdbT with pleckstrin-like domain